jgi:hypothetical protein
VGFQKRNFWLGNEWKEAKKNGNDLQRAQVKQLLWYVFPRAVTTSPSTNRPQWEHLVPKRS